MLAEIDECVTRSESFAFETTLAGLAYLRRIKHWRALGYHVSLFFLRLPNPEVAIARVAARVRRGGHAIPELVIRRRFAAGLRNLEQVYKSQVDAWVVYDNAGDEPILVDWSQQP